MATFVFPGKLRLRIVRSISRIGFQPVNQKVTGWKPFYTPQVNSYRSPASLRAVDLISRNALASGSLP